MSELLLRGGTVIDGVEPLRARRRDVLIVGERIAALEPDLVAPEGTRAVDVSGLTLLPGLIDCHVHLVLSGAPDGRIGRDEPLARTTLRAAANASRTLRRGITTVRDLGGRHGVEFELRSAIAAGELSGPEIVAAGQIIAITSSVSEQLSGMFCEADTAAQLRTAAREQLKRGADVLKVMASGAVMGERQDPRAAHFTADEIAAVVAEARRESRRVAAHAHSVEAMRNALAAGVASIEHGTYLCEDERTIEQLAASDAYLVPTLSFLHQMVVHGSEGLLPAFMLEQARRARDLHFESFRRAAALGVRMAFGTDTGSPYCLHGCNCDELALWAELGYPPAETLAAATSRAAGCLGLAAEVGTLQPGKLADVLIVEGDPLADLRCLDNVRTVLKRGRLAAGDPLPMADLELQR